MDKKQREERRRQEDIALQRGLLWVAGAIVLEVLLIFIDRFYIKYYITEAEVNRALAIRQALVFLRMAAPIATVLAAAWAVWQLKQGKKFGLPLVGAVAMAAVSVCSHVALKFAGPGVSMLFWLVIAWAVLALVFYIYQREFFLAASACGMSVLALWFVRYGASGRLEALLLLAAIAVVTGVSFWLKKNIAGLTPEEASKRLLDHTRLKKTGGVVPIQPPVQFLPKKTSYGVLLATCGASLAAVIGAMAVGGSTAYYLIYVMVAWLFALFVYYTVKLM